MGANNFIAFSPIPVGAAVGPQGPVDLWTLVPSTGLSPGFTVICVGDFSGAIAIEGSLDGVNYSPVGVDASGKSAGGFTVGARASEATADAQYDLSPLNVLDVIRYLRPRVGLGTTVRGPVQITVGGQQNCVCGTGPTGGGVNSLSAGTGIILTGTSTNPIISAASEPYDGDPLPDAINADPGDDAEYARGRHVHPLGDQIVGTLAVGNIPVASAVHGLTSGPLDHVTFMGDSSWGGQGSTQFTADGGDVTSAATVTLESGNNFQVLGTTAISRISTPAAALGEVRILFYFPSATPIISGAANSGVNKGIDLIGGTNWTAVPGSLLELVYGNNGRWIEVGRRITGIVSSQTLGSDATDVTFSGLTGNSDGAYDIDCEILNASGSTDIVVTLRWNGSATNVKQGAIIGNTSAGTITSASDRIGFVQQNTGSASSGCASLKGRVYPRTTGFARTAEFAAAVGINFLGSTEVVSIKSSSVWNNLTDEVTSLVIHSDVASGFKAGSRFVLRKVPMT